MKLNGFQKQFQKRVSKIVSMLTGAKTGDLSPRSSQYLRPSQAGDYGLCHEPARRDGESGARRDPGVWCGVRGQEIMVNNTFFICYGFYKRMGDLFGMPHRLHLFDHLESIESRAEEWSDFSDSCRLAAPFCGPQVWIPWLRSHQHLAPAVYEWREDGELRALLPMFRRGGSLEMATGPHLDYQDLAALDTETAVLILLAIARKEAGRHATFVFPKVVPGSRLAKALEDPRISAGTHHERRYWSQCPVASIDLSDRADFFDAIPARQRKDYRNARNRIAAAYPEYLVEHHGPGAFDPALLDDAVAQHRANQYRKSGESVCADPAYVRFLKDQASSGAPLCLSLIREHPGGPLMAFHLGYFANDTFYYYLTSFSGEHAKVSPGRWLLVDALRHWSGHISGSVLRFDMLCGEDGYKFRWTMTSYPVSRVVLIPKRLANLPRILAYSTIYRLKNVKNRLRLQPHGGLIHTLDPEDIALPG